MWPDTAADMAQYINDNGNMGTAGLAFLPSGYVEIDLRAEYTIVGVAAKYVRDGDPSSDDAIVKVGDSPGCGVDQTTCAILPSGITGHTRQWWLKDVWWYYLPILTPCVVRGRYVCVYVTTSASGIAIMDFQVWARRPESTEVCPPNAHLNNSRTSLAPLTDCLCDAGFSGTTPGAWCTACDAGKYKHTPGMHSCQACADIRFMNQQCFQWLMGTVKDDGQVRAVFMVIGDWPAGAIVRISSRGLRGDGGVVGRVNDVVLRRGADTWYPANINPKHHRDYAYTIMV